MRCRERVRQSSEVEPFSLVYGNSVYVSNPGVDWSIFGTIHFPANHRLCAQTISHHDGINYYAK